MGDTRIAALEAMVEQNPDNTFARYGLALEYANTGQLEKAVKAFDALLAKNPDYSAAYYHGGQALEKMGRLKDARALYQRGIEVTTALGDLHTRSEIQAALDLL